VAFGEILGPNVGSDMSLSLVDGAGEPRRNSQFLCALLITTPFPELCSLEPVQAGAVAVEDLCKV